MNASKLSALLVAGIPLLYAGCGGDSLTLPSEGEPAHITVVRGSGQSGRVQTQLGDSLVVKVTDTQDRPVANATVQFAFDDATAGGSVTPGSTTTDVNGEASSSITLGTRVGQMTGHATVPVPEGTVPVTTAFMAIATSADANGIAMVSGDPQQGAVGTTLPQPLVVQVTDNFGNPIPGINIDWTVTGGGSVSQSPTSTDGNGLASVQRTLGNTAGEQTTVATATGLAGSPVTFTHVATAGNASRVLIVSGNNQEGPPSTELDDPLVVQVLDANDNPIVGANVTWVVGTGDGTVNPQTNQTDGNGRSSVRWTLGAEPGPNVVNAVVSGVGVARFEATGRGSSTTRITSRNPDQSVVGQRVAVAVSVTGSGGTPSGSVTVNGESVAQPCSITLSNGSGSCEIAFTAPGSHRVTATYSGDSRFTGSSDDDTHQVNAIPNLAPVTQPDEYSTNEDTPLSVSAGDGVLRNDQDPEGGPLTAVNASDAANGSVDVNEDGSFTYTPDPDFFGDDSFTYRAKDNVGNETTATVTIHVAPVNDAPSFSMPGAGTQLNVPPDVSISVDDWTESMSPGPGNEAGQTIAFVVTTNNDVLFTQLPSINSGGTLTFTTTGTGDATVTVVLVDDGGVANGGNNTSASQNFAIHSEPGATVIGAP